LSTENKDSAKIKVDQGWRLECIFVVDIRKHLSPTSYQKVGRHYFAVDQSLQAL